jgi:hypothetical protein
MKRYEYLILKVNLSDENLKPNEWEENPLQKKFNELGEEGWKLINGINYSDVRTKIQYTFRRRLKELL